MLKMIKKTKVIQEATAVLDDTGDILREDDLNISENQLWTYIMEAINEANGDCENGQYRYLTHYFSKDVISSGTGSITNKIAFDWILNIIMELER